jgi:hypothetical protein
MWEVVGTFLGKAAGSFVKPLWDWYRQRNKRPELQNTKAPKNILEQLQPAASKDYVQSLLGPPHQVVHDHWFYRFSDGLVQLEFWKEGGAKFIAVGIVGTSKDECFPVPGFGKPLGRLSIEDVMEPGAVQSYRSSLRHEEVFVENRIGPPGKWTTYAFGALRSGSGAGSLQDTNFQWDAQADRLRTPPSLVLVNWAAVGSDAWFDWTMT